MPTNKVRSVFNIRSGIIATVVFVVVFALAFLLLPQSWLGYGLIAAIVVGALSAVLVGYAFGRIEQIRESRIPEQWMREIVPLNQWISDELFQDICFIMGRAGTMATKSPRDRYLNLITRKTKYFAFLRLLPVVAVAVLLLTIMVALTVYSNGHQSSSSYTTEGWLLLVVMTPLLYVTGWFRLIPWLYEYLAVDDGNLFICKIPPAFLFWYERSVTPYRLFIGETVTAISKGWIANTGDFGTIQFATQLQDSEDTPIREIRFVPNVHKVAVIMNQGMERSKAELHRTVRRKADHPASKPESGLRPPPRR